MREHDRQPLTLEAMEGLGFKLLCPLGYDAGNMEAVIRIEHPGGWANEFRMVRTMHGYLWRLDVLQHNMGNVEFSYVDQVVALIDVLRGEDGYVLREGYASLISEWEKYACLPPYSKAYLDKELRYSHTV